MGTRRTEGGFSLIELLIVVAVILIIAAIAVPNFLKARMAANESSAVSAMRTIASSAHLYWTKHPDIGFPANLLAMGPPPGDNLLDAPLASGFRGGFRYDYLVTVTSPCATCVGGVHNDDFRLCGDPASGNRTGSRAYFASADNVVHFLTPVPNGPVGPCAATAANPPI